MTSILDVSTVQSITALIPSADIIEPEILREMDL